MRAVIARMSELYGYRELLRNFLVRDLSVRYKGSALGVLWSLLNPALMMIVYTIVFSHVLRVNTHDYPVFFMAGFLPWLFFATTLQQGSISLLSNTSLIQKVYFPREVLPLSISAANLVNLGIALGLFLPLVWWRDGLSLRPLLALIPVTIALALLASGFAMLLSAGMVYFRDTEFLLGIALNAWFFVTPIIYPYTTISNVTYGSWFKLNPMLPFVSAYRSAIYAQTVPGTKIILICCAWGVITFTLCYRFFDRVKGRVAEEL
jgi:lipopolysaccharide transport system permease protein